MHLSSRGLKVRRAWLAVAAVVALTLGIAGPTAAAAAAERAEYTVPAGKASGHLGTVTGTEPLPSELWLPNTADAYRLKYISTGFDGRKTVVSGVVYLPDREMPKRGWPVVSWAHGTLGVADVCAPSRTGASPRDAAYLAKWLDAGYAVVATDYEGLGTPGPHPYLNGRSQAYGAIDMVRAARSVDRKRLSRSWIVVGQSQGGQTALHTAAIANDYAPELDYRGAIATAPPTQFRMNAEGLDFLNPEGPAFGYIPLVIDAHETMWGDAFAPSEYLTAKGADIYLRARDELCIGALFREMAGFQMKDYFAMDPAEIETFIDLWTPYADVPIAAYDRPVLIGQGTADTDVHPPTTINTVEKLEAAGTDVTLLLYEGLAHSGPMQTGFPEFRDFAEELFAERR